MFAAFPASARLSSSRSTLPAKRTPPGRRHIDSASTSCSSTCPIESSRGQQTFSSVFPALLSEKKPFPSQTQPNGSLGGKAYKPRFPFSFSPFPPSSIHLSFSFLHRILQKFSISCPNPLPHTHNPLQPQPQPKPNKMSFSTATATVAFDLVMMTIIINWTVADIVAEKAGMPGAYTK